MTADHRDTGWGGWGGSAPAHPSGARRAPAALRSAPRTVLVGLLRLYQRVVSPLYGPTCRFYPSCSQYAVVAIDRHGAVRGVGLAAWRLLRCNPWNSGGVDDVPPARGQDAHEHRQHHQH